MLQLALTNFTLLCATRGELKAVYCPFPVSTCSIMVSSAVFPAPAPAFSTRTCCPWARAANSLLAISSPRACSSVGVIPATVVGMVVPPGVGAWTVAVATDVEAALLRSRSAAASRPGEVCPLVTGAASGSCAVHGVAEELVTVAPVAEVGSAKGQSASSSVNTDGTA